MTNGNLPLVKSYTFYERRYALHEHLNYEISSINTTHSARGRNVCMSLNSRFIQCPPDATPPHDVQANITSFVYQGLPIQTTARGLRQDHDNHYALGLATTDFILQNTFHKAFENFVALCRLATAMMYRRISR